MQVNQDNAMTTAQFIRVIESLAKVLEGHVKNSDWTSREHTLTGIAYMHVFAGASDDEMRALATQTGGNLVCMFGFRREIQSASGRSKMLLNETAFGVDSAELDAELVKHDFDKEGIPKCCAAVIRGAMGEPGLVPA